MCIKYVYYNTYSDGIEDITERVESCTPGYICPNPQVQEFDRDYACPRDQAKIQQARGDRRPGGPKVTSGSASPRSSSPSSAGPASDASSCEPREPRGPRRHRRRTSDVYVNGTKVSSTSTTTSSPKPPSSPRTMPIPIQRAATMTYGGMEPPPERGRRPIIVEERVPSLHNTPRMMPIPMPDIYHHTTNIASTRPRPAAGLRDFREFREMRDLRNDFREFRPVGHMERTSSLRRPSMSMGMGPSTPPMDSNFLSPNRARADRSPQGYGSAEDEQERKERRRRRRAAKERAAVMPSSLPTMGATDVFGSSPSSNSGVGSAATSASASPAVSAVKKELRWEDEQRRRQNERIAARPKLPRSQAVPTNTKLQGEVKSILKNSTSNSASASTSPAPPAEGRSRASSRASSRPPSSSSRRASFVGPVGEMDDIFTTGLSGLNISNSTAPGTSAAATAGGTVPPTFDDFPLDDAERSRLRNRFSMPARRYTAGGSHRRRTEYLYPDESRYRFY